VGVGSIYALTGVIFGKVRRLENISLGLVYNGFGTQTHLSLLLKKSFSNLAMNLQAQLYFHPLRTCW
jgi:hypothetical protein